MSQSEWLGAVLIAGFVLYLAANQRLGVYWSLLTGGAGIAPPSAAAPATTSPGAPQPPAAPSPSPSSPTIPTTPQTGYG